MSLSLLRRYARYFAITSSRFPSIPSLKGFPHTLDLPT